MAHLVVVEQLDSDDDLEELLSVVELEKDGCFSSMSTSDGEAGTKSSQRTSGLSSLQGQSITSPLAKRSRRAEGANLNIDAALDPDNYEEMDIPLSSFKTFTACLGPEEGC